MPVYNSSAVGGEFAQRGLTVRARQVLSWRQKPLEELPDSLQRLVEMRSPHAAECKLCQHVIQHRAARADS